MNKVILVGRVEYPPRFNENAESKFPPVLNLTVKCTHRYKANDGTVQERSQRIKSALWGKLAELNRNVQEGDLVALEGRLQNKQVQDKQGNEHWETQVIANMFESLDGVEGESLDTSTDQTKPDRLRDAAKAHVAEAKDEFDDDSIPF